MNYRDQFWQAFIRMQSKEKVVVVILAALFVFSFGRFLLYMPWFTMSDDATIVAEGIVGKITALNPLYVDFNDTDRDVAQLIFSGLVRYDPRTKNFIPDLATSWERSSNGLVYTFTLRSNAIWHDSTPITADDIIFTFRDVIKDPGFRNPILRSAFEGVTVEKIGPFVVKFSLEKPNSYFISSLTTGLVPYHLLKETPIATLEKSAFSVKPIGSGPYMMTAVNLENDGDYVDLQAFPSYYGRAPLITKFRIFTFPSEQALARHKFALHAIGKLLSESALMHELKNDARFIIKHYILNQFSALYFNTDHPALAKKEVRTGLMRALDKNALVVKGERRVDTVEITDLSSDKRFGYNPQEAASLLDQAGYTRSAGEVIRTDNKGVQLKLRLLMHAKMSHESAKIMTQQLHEAGIKVEVISADGSDFLDYVTKRRYDLLFIRQNLGYNRDIYPLFHSSQVGGQSPSTSGLNFSNFRSFRTDGLTEAIRKEKNPKDKEKLLRQLSSILADEVPLVFISTPVYGYAIDRALKGFDIDALDFHSDRFAIVPYLQFTPAT